MKIYNPNVTQNIHDLSLAIAKEARKEDQIMLSNFNGVEIVAKPGDRAEVIANYYRKQILPFSVTNTEEWKEFVKASKRDAFMGFYVRHAARWANIMEREMACGKKLEDIAGTTCSEADLEGMSGHGVDQTVRILMQVWGHGEELRCWRNSKFGEQGKEANRNGTLLSSAVFVKQA